MDQMKTNLMSNNFFLENRAVYNVKKYGRAGQGTGQYTTAHARCMLAS
jgi:hypothetical protein